MKAWDEFLAQLEPTFTDEVKKKWIRPLKVVSFDARNLYLEAQDGFQAKWFDEHLLPVAKKKLLNNNGRAVKIHLAVSQSPPTKKTTRRNKGKKQEVAAPPFKITFDPVDPSLTFDNFIVSESNYVPHQLIKELSTDLTSPKVNFNPIYLYGRSGTGKTHLLMALYHAAKAKGHNVIYSRAESFTQHMVSAIRAGEMSAFREAYRHVDMLLLDNVHTFSGKKATQEELFHTFNTLHVAEKKIILGALCAPQELENIEPRLVSRFEWGIALPIEPLKSDELLQMLQKKCDRMSFPLAQPVKKELVEIFSRDPSRLLKAIDALAIRAHRTYPSLSSTQLTSHMVKTTLSDLMSEVTNEAVTPERILDATARFFGLPVDEILGKSQSRECALPRQIAMYVCRTELNLPFMKLGHLFSRDHSTVMSAVQRIQEQHDQNDEHILSAIRSIKKRIRE